MVTVAIAALVGLTTLGASAAAPAAGPVVHSADDPPTSTPGPTFQPLTSVCGNATPQISMVPRHIVVILMENESRGAIVGSAKAPYQTALAHQCGEATNLYAVSHPSLPNYVALNSGVSEPATNKDCAPNPTKGTCVSSDPNLFLQTENAGLSWRDYAEDMSKPCQLNNAGNYVPRHNPAVYFTDLAVTSPGHASDCATYDIPMGDLVSQTGQFYSDLAAGALPSYTFITPNLLDDAHSSSVQVGDSYLQRLVPLITASPNYQDGDTDIVITYDEGAGKDKVLGEDCTNQSLDQAGLQPSCNIPFLVISPYEAAGTVSSAFCTLYCLTRTIETEFGLPLLGHAADATTRDLTTDFNLSPTGVFPPTTTATATVTATPPPTVRQYVGNTGVENDSSGWLGKYNATSGTKLVQVPGGSHDGNWALQVTNGSGGSLAAGVSNKKPMWVDGATVPSVAGTTYTASVWVNGAAGTKVSLRLNDCSAGGVDCTSGKTAAVVLGAATWTQITVPLTESASGRSIGFLVFATLPAGSSFLADTFSLTSPLP